MLVRSTKILTPFLKGSPELFSGGFFDTFYVFNEENRTGTEKVGGITVTFVDVSYIWQTFPSGFDPIHTEGKWTVKNVKWGYCQMIRFFWKSLFEIPEIEKVSQYMRLDGDSCISRLDESPFDRLNNGVIYVNNDQFYDLETVCVNLRAFTEDYVRYFQITPRNPHAWSETFAGGSVAGYYNNLEIMDVAFWLKPEVQHFVQFVDTSWGIYLYRWGDAPLRYIALALFATREQVTMRPWRWRYEHPCREN
jgi:hypothetical protein